MANPEHLEILKRYGVEYWNNLRKDNFQFRPDLSDINLSRKNLRGVNFIESNLFKTNLCKTNLYEANLFKANLVEADLYDSSLRRSNLIGTNMSRANLSRADLSYAKIYVAELLHAKLVNAILVDCDLHLAKLGDCNLIGTDLRFSNLTEADFSKSNLTGAKLYGSSRDDWNIEGVKCDYIYWDKDGEIKSPKDRNFAPGEFEQLYKTLPTIEYIFQNVMLPIDPLIMDRVVQAIREVKPKFDLKIDSINARGLAPSIKFTVQQEEHKEPALQEIVNGYETYIARLETDKEKLSILLSQALENNRLDKLLLGQAIEKAGDTIITGNDSNVSTRGSEINIVQHYNNSIELQKAIMNEPSKSFRKIAKKKALDVIGGALEDLAKDEVKSATSKIIELGKKLGPWFMKTTAYAYFKSKGIEI